MAAATHYENFPVASWVGPPAARAAIASIYAFARSADDIADEGNDPPALRLARLGHYEAMLDRIERGEQPDEAPFAALAENVRRHTLPVPLLRQLLSAFRQDVTQSRYATFEDLRDYCTRSANPVGRLLLHLYGVEDANSLAQSDAICTGLQLANFWQDVAIDWTKNRVYLPTYDMEQFAVTPTQIADGLCDSHWTALMAFETARARQLFESGRALARSLPRRARIEFNMVVAGGMRILAAIDRLDGDVFRHRPTLRRRDWVAMLATALVR